MVWESGESFKRNMWQSFMVWESGESFKRNMWQSFMVWESGESFKRNMWQSFMVWESGESFCSIFGHNPRGWQSRRIPAFWESWTWSNVDLRACILSTSEIKEELCWWCEGWQTTLRAFFNSLFHNNYCSKFLTSSRVMLETLWRTRVCKECGHFRKENAVPERARREGASPGRVFKWKEKRP